MSRFQRPFKVLANPTLELGVWKPSVISSRKMGFIRKQTLMLGQEWENPRTRFHVPSEKDDRVKNVYGQYKPNKGAAWERKRENRLKKIEQKMKEMPKLIEAHKKAKAKKPIPKAFNMLVPFEIPRVSSRKRKDKMKADIGKKKYKSNDDFPLD